MIDMTRMKKFEIDDFESNEEENELYVIKALLDYDNKINAKCMEYLLEDNDLITKIEKEAPILFEIDIEPNKVKSFVDGNKIRNVMSAIVLSINQQIDEKIIEEMYKIYKETEISTVYLIDKNQFKDFINTMLPKYMEERKGK